MKNKILVAFMVVFSMMGLANLALGCPMSCSAICRYTCQGTPQSETGCSDADYASSLQRCCEQTFANHPEMNNVPCTAAGGES